MSDISKIGGTLTERAYSQIRRMILAVELQPGERLIASELAEAFGVSATPVREAIRMLEMENLVDVMSHKGAVVRSLLSPGQVCEIYVVRSELEQLAIRLALPALNEEHLSQLQKITDGYADAVDENDYEKALMWDLHFHEYFVKATGNKVLQEILTGLETRIQTLRRMDHGSDRLRQSLSDHRLIVNALRSTDVNTANEIMNDHIMRGMEHVIALLDMGGINEKQ